jgi:excisionase family DNA binding protein
MEELVAVVSGLLESGKDISIVVAETEEMLSPQRASEILGFSRQHVQRLVNAGELHALRMPNSTHWQIPFSSVVEFEQRRNEADERFAAHSRELDDLGAPLE